MAAARPATLTAAELTLAILVAALIGCYVLLPLDRGFPTVPLLGRPLNSAIAATLAVLGVMVFQSRGAVLSYLREPYCLLQSGYCLLLVASALRAHGPLSALHSSFLYYCTFVLNYVILRQITAIHGTRWLSAVVVTMGVAAAAVGIGQGALGIPLPAYDAWFEDYFSVPAENYALPTARVAGTMSNPILYGFLLALLIPYAIDLKRLVNRGVVLYTALFAAGLSGSRTAVLAVAVFACGALIVHRWRAVRALPVVAFGLVLLFWSFAALTAHGQNSRVTFLLERTGLTSASPASPSVPAMRGSGGSPSRLAPRVKPPPKPPSETAKSAALGISLRKGALMEGFREITREWGPLTWMFGRGYFAAAAVGEKVSVGYNTVDNVFLSVLYERGLSGLALFVGAFVTFLYRTRRVATTTLHWYAPVVLGAAGVAFCWDAYSTFNILAVGSMAVAMWHTEQARGSRETLLGSFLADKGIAGPREPGYDEVRSLAPSVHERSMKIAVVSIFYSEGMGYTENCLPRALAARGHEVHVITTVFNVYGNQADYAKTYQDFLGPNIMSAGTASVDGYQVHRLDAKVMGGYVVSAGLAAKVRQIAPDFVHSLEIASLQTFELALLKPFAGYALFCETHQHMSVVKPFLKRSGALFRKALYRITRTLPTRLASLAVEKCYAIAPDCAEVATRFYGVPPDKVKLQSLGADTELFRPVETEADAAARVVLRRTLGFSEEDIVCVYSGRFSRDKNPLLLARAIDDLHGRDSRFKGLFIGEGEQKDGIAACRNTKILPFMKHRRLAEHYRAADIAVWPTQESMSMLDAAASGLPIVVSNTVGDIERVCGNGRVYEENDVNSLVEALCSLASPADRITLGAAGRRKALTGFNWRRYAQSVEADYHDALKRSRALAHFKA